MTKPVNVETNSSTINTATTLGWVNDDKSKLYMRELIKRGHLILLAHNWKIKHLKEFYPRSARLLGLNVNKGEEVCIRFRPPGSKETFLPFHEVLCTLIHEIVHCRFSRHDKKFWELYAELVIECDRLEIQIISKGSLNYNFNNINHLNFTGGYRLGGNSSAPPINNSNLVRQVIADAAQRRLQNSKYDKRDGCMSDNSNLNNVLNSKDLWICNRCGGTNNNISTLCDFCSDIIILNEKKEEEEEGGWNCRRCSFHNYCNLQKICEACTFPRFTENSSNLKFIVQRINALSTFSDYLFTCGFLGRLADSINPLLEEKKWQLICLDEFTPQIPSLISQGDFINEGRATIKIRLRLPHNNLEFLPIPYIYTSIFHQLAHMIDRNHSLNFLKEWISLIQRFLILSEVRKDIIMEISVKENLLNFISQLEKLVKIQEECDNKSLISDDIFYSINFLFADCGNVVKRERSPPIDSKKNKSKEWWSCSQCSFHNHNISFLFCEVCSASRSISPFKNEIKKISSDLSICDEPVIIIDSDNDENNNNNNENIIDIEEVKVQYSVNSEDVVIIL